MTHSIDAAAETVQQGDAFHKRWRRIAFCLILAFIYLGPAPGQLFGQHSPWLREWIMFSGVGVGIPDGTFIVTAPDGSTEAFTPLEAAGLDQYPIIWHYQFDRRILKKDQFEQFATALCDEAPATHDVSFDGAVGTREGWRAAQVDNICVDEEPDQ